MSYYNKIKFNKYPSKVGKTWNAVAVLDIEYTLAYVFVHHLCHGQGVTQGQHKLHHIYKLSKNIDLHEVTAKIARGIY